MCELLHRLSSVLDQVPGGPHEMVFVDDGSSDRTFPILEEVAVSDARMTLVSFSRNFGHQAALSAALDHVTGDAVILMDGDLVDTPEFIPMFIEKFNQGYDVVYAQRINRKEPWWLRLCYYAFYRLLASLSDIRLPLDAGDFGLMSRRVVDQLCQMPEHHRYIRGLRSWVGYRQIGIPIERAERHWDGRNTVPCVCWDWLSMAYLHSLSSPCVQQRFSALLIWDSQAYSPSTASLPSFFNPVPSRFHSTHHFDHIPRRLQPTVSRNHRRIRRKDLPRSKGAPPLHHQEGHTRSGSLCACRSGIWMPRGKLDMDFAYGQRYRDLYYKHWWWRVHEPTFKGSESPFRFFVLRALHTTRSRGPAHHRAAGDRIGHHTSARPADHLLLIGS